MEFVAHVHYLFVKFFVDVYWTDNTEKQDSCSKKKTFMNYKASKGVYIILLPCRVRKKDCQQGI
jgi:hypothetical protein